MLRRDVDRKLVYNDATRALTTLGSSDVDKDPPIYTFDECLRPIRPGELPETCANAYPEPMTGPP